MPNDIDSKDKAMRWFGMTPIQRAQNAFPQLTGEMIRFVEVSPQTFYKWRKEWEVHGNTTPILPTATYIRTADNFAKPEEIQEEFDTIEYLKANGLKVAKAFVSMLISGKANPKSFEIYYGLTGDISKAGTSQKEKGLNATDLAKVVRQHDADKRAETERMDEMQGQPQVLHPDLLPDSGQGAEDDDAIPSVEISGITGGLDIRPDDPRPVHPEGTATGDIVGVLRDSPPSSPVL
jgi:hypothetical protein